MPHPTDASTPCLNCGAALTGPYCAQCGQYAESPVKPFRRFFADLFQDYFSLDTRFLRTLYHLFRRPGHLTQSYLRGHRARYLPPLRLYLVTSFLLFFSLAVIDRETRGFINIQDSSADGTSQRIGADSVTVRPDTLAAVATPPPETPSAATIERDMEDGVDRAVADRDGFYAMLLDRTPIMMFMLQPLFALLLMLLYLRQRRLYAEHFIFSLHIHAFAYLVLTGLLLIEALGVPMVVGDNFDLTALFVLIASFVYLYFALRRVYQQSRAKTGLKLFLLGLTYLMLWTFAFAAVVIGTLLTS